MEKLLNTSCLSQSVAVMDGVEMRLPIQIDLTSLPDIQTEADILRYFTKIDVVCDCKNCLTVILEITGFSNRVTQTELDEYASKICKIFEARYVRVTVFTFSENNCGFYKTTHFENSERAAHVA